MSAMSPIRDLITFHQDDSHILRLLGGKRKEKGKTEEEPMDWKKCVYLLYSVQT